MTQTAMTRPDYTKVFGLTHELNGTPIIRVPRSLKVSIGQLAGPDLHVYIDRGGKWTVQEGYKEGTTRKIRLGKFNTLEEAKRQYRALRADGKTFLRNYPLKLAYFTFSKVGPDGALEPDFETIEHHGSMPTELDIIFTDERPFEASYKMYSAKGLLCSGDGVTGERAFELAHGPDELALVGQAKELGLKKFPIIDGCATKGCPYTQQSTSGSRVNPPACKSHARLSFQLIRDIRIGGKACFDTTGIVSIMQLFGGLNELLTLTGRGDPAQGNLRGVPARLAVRPFKTNHDGKPGTAYCVSIELRADSIASLGEKLLESQQVFRAIMPAPQPDPIPEARQIAAAVEVATTDADDEMADDAPDPAAMVAEFGYPDDAPVEAVEDIDEGDPGIQPQQTPSAEIAQTTAAKTDALATKLRGQKATSPAPTATPIATSNGQPTPATPADSGPPPPPIAGSNLFEMPPAKPKSDPKKDAGDFF